MKISKNVLKRVDAGVAFLNVVKPDWLKRIDVSKLDLGNAKVCILGELYNSYENGVLVLGLDDETSSISLGFYDFDKRQYEQLTQAWKNKITKLRKVKI